MFFDNIMTCRLIICFIDDTASYGPSRKNSILINKHALNREPVPLNNNGPPTLSKRLNAIVFQDCVWGAFYVSRSFQKPTSEVSSCRDWLHRLTIAALYVLPSEAHKKNIKLSMFQFKRTITSCTTRDKFFKAKIKLTVAPVMYVN